MEQGPDDTYVPVCLLVVAPIDMGICMEVDSLNLTI